MSRSGRFNYAAHNVFAYHVIDPSKFKFTNVPIYEPPTPPVLEPPENPFHEDDFVEEESKDTGSAAGGTEDTGETNSEEVGPGGGGQGVDGNMPSIPIVFRHLLTCHQTQLGRQTLKEMA